MTDTLDTANNEQYQEIIIEAPADWEERLSMLLFAHGAAGVEIDDPAIIARHLALGDWDASVFDGQQVMTGRVTLRALFPATQQLQALCDEYAVLTTDQAQQFQLRQALVPAYDWQAAWKSHFPDLPLGERLLVRPYWRAGAETQGRLEILISPGMAFGTGDHATTALALELLERHLRPDDAVLDVGCGSGILSIAALKLGAGRVLAVDLDEACAPSVAEHWRLNGYAAAAPVLIGDILRDAHIQNACRAFQADVLVSNIVSAVLAELAPRAADYLPADGLWLLSGILLEKEAVLRETLAQCGWQVRERLQREDWLAFCCGRENG